MRLLLDTHIWLWNFQEPRRLGRRVLRHLQDKENELWLSPMSTWEALTLNYKGRIRIKEDLATWLTRATAGTLEAPLTHEIALVARQLPLHQDPADRILAATAEVLDLTLVTADERLLGLGTIRTFGDRARARARSRFYPHFMSTCSYVAAGYGAFPDSKSAHSWKQRALSALSYQIFDILKELYKGTWVKSPFA